MRSLIGCSMACGIGALVALCVNKPADACFLGFLCLLAAAFAVGAHR